MDRSGRRADAGQSLLVVGLKHEVEQIAEIMRVLGGLDIAACHRAREGGSEASDVLVQIPADRVLEAVLALNYHGFVDVRVRGGAAETGER